MKKSLFLLCFVFCFWSADSKACGDDWIVVLGTGGVHGSAYKKEIFRTLTEENPRILLCTPDTSPLRGDLESAGLVREVLSVSPEDELRAFEIIKQHCEKRNIRAFFTVRENWLGIASQLSKAWKLPYQGPEAFRLAQNKEETRRKLVECGLKSVPYTVSYTEEFAGQKTSV